MQLFYQLDKIMQLFYQLDKIMQLFNFLIIMTISLYKIYAYPYKKVNL